MHSKLSSNSASTTSLASTSISVKRQAIAAKPRKLQAKWTVDAGELNAWSLSDDIKEAIELELLKNVMDHTANIIVDCHEAISPVFNDWLHQYHITNPDFIEPNRLLFKDLATICNNISTEDEFTLTMAGMKKWPTPLHQAS